MRNDTRAGARADLAQYPLGHRPAPRLGNLLLVSLLVMLNLPLSFTTITGTDQYGFFTLNPVSAYPLPLVLSTVLSSTLAVAGFACYSWLWRRQLWFTGGHWGPLARGAVLSGTPVLLAYAPSIVLTSHGWKPTLIALGALVAAALSVTHALRDSETDLDPIQARYWFICALGSILVFLVLCIGGMIVLYKIEQFPASGNLLWTWEYPWSELGYPREEYHPRQRDALLGFTLTGTGFMVAALGGSMLAAILRWTRLTEPDTPASSQSRRPKRPQWVTQLARRLGAPDTSLTEDPEYVAVCNGFDVPITGVQYQRLTARREELLYDVDLVVDKVTSDVFVQSNGTWTRLDFRVRGRLGNLRSGPFALLCVLARHPGRRFPGTELRALLEPELSDRDWLGVSDFTRQLQTRKHRLPVERDHRGSFLQDGIRVCLLERQQKPVSDDAPSADGRQPD